MFFFFKQKTAYEFVPSLVGSEMCIRDRADILKIAMINIDRRFREEDIRSKMLLQVHDELIFNVLCSEIEVVTGIIREEMENVYKLSVPLRVDINYGKNWYEAK